MQPYRAYHEEGDLSTHRTQNFTQSHIKSRLDLMFTFCNNLDQNTYILSALYKNSTRFALDKLVEIMYNNHIINQQSRLETCKTTIANSCGITRCHHMIISTRIMHIHICIIHTIQMMIMHEIVQTISNQLTYIMHNCTGIVYNNQICNIAH